jgi:hypothetical protein
MIEPSHEEPRPHRSTDDSYRMDILMKVVSADRASGEIQYVIYPDPKRYEREVSGVPATSKPQLRGWPVRWQVLRKQGMELSSVTGRPRRAR